MRIRIDPCVGGRVGAGSVAARESRGGDAPWQPRRRDNQPSRGYPGTPPLIGTTASLSWFRSRSATRRNAKSLIKSFIVPRSFFSGTDGNGVELSATVCWNLPSAMALFLAHDEAKSEGTRAFPFFVQGFSLLNKTLRCLLLVFVCVTPARCA